MRLCVILSSRRSFKEKLIMILGVNLKKRTVNIRYQQNTNKIGEKEERKKERKNKRKIVS